ncbi:MAG: WbuC family cupin fold metalloprotein [Akkermansiaceae bacterium]|jgi:cupin fold WbuC family metalloprotein
MPNALPNPEGSVFLPDESLFQKGREESRKSPRLRMIQPLQRDQESRVQRLLNFLQPGTYIRPHCHPLPHATESVCVLAGQLELLIFEPNGEILERHHLTPERPLVDLEPGVWHGMIVHQPDTIIFEVKQGPYDPSTDKEFASWAPAEDSDEVAAYLAKLSQ